MLVFRFGFSVDKLGPSRTDTTYIRIQVEIFECKYCFGKRYFRAVDITVLGTINFCFAFLASWYMLWLSRKVYKDAETYRIFVLCVYHFLIKEHDVPPLNFQSYWVLRLSKEDSNNYSSRIFRHHAQWLIDKLVENFHEYIMCAEQNILKIHYLPLPHYLLFYAHYYLMIILVKFGTNVTMCIKSYEIFSASIFFTEITNIFNQTIIMYLQVDFKS